MIQSKLELPARIASLERKIDKLAAIASKDNAARIAFLKFATVGEAGIPMRAAEVAVVLGVELGRVHNLATAKLLNRRWAALYHPDDVRAYLTSIARKDAA